MSSVRDHWSSSVRGHCASGGQGRHAPDILSIKSPNSRLTWKSIVDLLAEPTRGVNGIAWTYGHVATQCCWTPSPESPTRQPGQRRCQPVRPDEPVGGVDHQRDLLAEVEADPASVLKRPPLWWPRSNRLGHHNRGSLSMRRILRAPQNPLAVRYYAYGERNTSVYRYVYIRFLLSHTISQLYRRVGHAGQAK